MVRGPLYHSIARLVVATDRKNGSGSSGAPPRGTRQGWPDPGAPEPGLHPLGRRRLSTGHGVDGGAT